MQHYEWLHFGKKKETETLSTLAAAGMNGFTAIAERQTIVCPKCEDNIVQWTLLAQFQGTSLRALSHTNTVPL